MTTTAKQAVSFDDDNDLLAIAAEKPKTAAAKKDKPIVYMREDEHEGISSTLKEVAELRDQAKENERRSDLLEKNLIELAKPAFVKLCNELKTNPTSFVMQGERGGSLTFTFKNAYKKIDKDRAIELATKYDKSLVTSETTLEFDAAMLKKYKAQVIALINSIELDKEDIAAGRKLVNAKQVFSLADGAINRLNEFNDQGFLYDIQPIIAITK